MSEDPVSRAEKALAEGKRRRRAYEVGTRQSEDRLSAAKQQVQRWRDEAKWWREEHDRVHAEFCEFVAYVASELGLNKPKEKS